MTSTSHDPRAWQRPEDELAARPASAHLVDPEDDLPSSTYAGDFETTAIPRYDSASGEKSGGFALLGDPEPLPYVQPSGRHADFAAEPTEIEPDARDKRAGDARRGTQDLGLMLLRVGLGALLIASVVYFQTRLGIWTAHELLISLFLFITAPISANMIAKVHLHRVRVGAISEPDSIAGAPPRPGGEGDWATFEAPKRDNPASTANT